MELFRNYLKNINYFAIADLVMILLVSIIALIFLKGKTMLEWQSFQPSIWLFISA